jgi:hypothetical protein
MIGVIDSLQLNEQALRHDPEFLNSLGPGLFVIIDAKQRLDAEGKPAFLVAPNSSVRIHRPDGSVIDRIVTGVEIWGQRVGLFFSNTQQHDIPISSEIELPA